MMRFSSLLRHGLLTLVLAAPLSGCDIILGIGGEEPLGPGGGGTGGGGATTDAGGTGGTGGLGGPCSPGDQTACYTGPEGTEAVGACKGGKASCSDAGTWGACDGQVVPALETCADSADEDCDGRDCTTWVKTLLGAVYGGPVAIDPQGNIVVAVVFTEGIDLGDGMPVVPVGSGDIALLKYDKAGALVWKRVFPAAGSQSVHAVAVDPAGNIAIGGSTTAELDFGKGKLPVGAFVAKLDPSGEALWSISGQSTSGAPSASHVAIDSKGNVLAGGNGGSIDLGKGVQSGGDAQSFWVAKLDKDSGQQLWLKITKGGSVETLAGLVVDSSDSPVLTGSWKGPYLGLAGAGETVPNDLYNNTMNDAIFLLRLDPDGKQSHGKMIAGQNSGFSGGVSGLDVDQFGWSALVGNFSGLIQFSQGSYDAGPGGGTFVVRDQTTSFDQWSKAYWDDNVYANFGMVAIDGSNDIVIAGQHDGAIDLGGGPLPAGAGGLVMKLDKEGAFLWNRTYTFGDGGIQGLAAGSLEDETVLVGSFYGTADFGDGVIDAQQGFFIVRLGK